MRKRGLYLQRLIPYAVRGPFAPSGRWLRTKRWRLGLLRHLRPVIKSGVLQTRAITAACLIATGIAVWGQEDLPASANSGVRPRVYEIVSIKPSNPGTVGGSMRTLPDGFWDTNIRLAGLVRGAYDIVMQSQVVGMPSWAESEPYDVEAKVDAETAEAWKRLTTKQRWKQEQPMLQALLADRCQLKVHYETREMPVYDLVIAKRGLKMKEAPSDEGVTERMTVGGTLIAQAMSVEGLVYAFSGTDGRLIVDKTGLGERKFDFDLRWTPDEQRAANPDDAGPSFFTALEEQLGLKLVPSKEPVQILVIDHMERPSPN
jgi:uncharacterized protein (TIGR03435 family)